MSKPGGKTPTQTSPGTAQSRNPRRAISAAGTVLEKQSLASSEKHPHDQKTHQPRAEKKLIWDCEVTAKAPGRVPPAATAASPGQWWHVLGTPRWQQQGKALLMGTLILMGPPARLGPR